MCWHFIFGALHSQMLIDRMEYACVQMDNRLQYMNERSYIHIYILYLYTMPVCPVWMCALHIFVRRCDMIFRGRSTLRRSPSVRSSYKNKTQTQGAPKLWWWKVWEQESSMEWAPLPIVGIYIFENVATVADQHSMSGCSKCMTTLMQGILFCSHRMYGYCCCCSGKW